jgi:hypothetical protein
MTVAPISPEREAELLRHVPTLATLDEAHAFRDALRAQGEQLTTALYAALLARIDLLRRREGK